MGKIYAVKCGKKTGIFSTWTECKEQVTGYPNASYKSFSTIEEANKFLSNIPIMVKSDNIAYTDGSYNDNTKEYGCGIVLFSNNEKKTFSFKGNDKEIVAMRNVAGEIMAAWHIMQYCIDNNLSSLVIYHDYEGVSKFCTGDWTANEIGTRNYRDFYNSIKNKLQVGFIWIRGHNKNQYNDEADHLAKQSIGIKIK